MLQFEVLSLITKPLRHSIVKRILVLNGRYRHIFISPGYYEKLKKLKMEGNGIPSCLILSLLIVFTWQLEILVTTQNQFCNYTYIILHSRSGCRHFV